MVWYGVAWRGLVLYCIVLYCIVWYRTVRWVHKLGNTTWNLQQWLQSSEFRRSLDMLVATTPWWKISPSSPGFRIWIRKFFRNVGNYLQHQRRSEHRRLLSSFSLKSVLRISYKSDNFVIFVNDFRSCIYGLWLHSNSYLCRVVN
jgi:hypothetical protein